ncbi:dynein light chain 1, cytoplasmic-like [Muntiacus reevesi]|uniref:dynein light chain 1, cytoplasmic-like n=1 Tax=Muntiacus reevesi TaxID=9886 RepID=UPI0033072566
MQREKKCGCGLHRRFQGAPRQQGQLITPNTMKAAQRLPLYAGVSFARPSPRRPLQSASPCSLVTTCDQKAVIKNADMSEEMQQDSVECATQALEKYNIEKDIAAHIKEFDKKYNPTWHCIVGRNFGSYVTHETKHLIYFYLGQVADLLFKSG